jgi:hypothetical protein
LFRTLALLAAMLASAPAMGAELTASDLLNSLGTDPGTDKASAIALVEATAKVVGIQESHAFIDGLGSRFPVHELQEKLVAACADLGNFDCAYYEAARIEPFNWRMRAMSQIASAYAEQGNDERARATFAFTLEVAAREAPIRYRDQLIVGILRSVGEFGYLDIAEGSIAHVDSPERRVDALFSLAHAAGRFKETAKAAELYEEGRLVMGDVAGPIDPWLYARGAVAAVAAGRPHVSERYLERAGEASEWAVGQITALYHHRGLARETEAWKTRIRSAQGKAWLQSLLAETSMKAGRCEEALALWHQVTAPSWAAASLLHMAEDNRRHPCLDGAIFVDEAQNAWLSLGSPDQITIGAQLATAIQASGSPSAAHSTN